ncbi:glycosyltransferase family 2 protein [Microbacterium sp. zg.Y1090]|uniref:glycosyltransferase family 2 protein n=1 Tax=Microbacterium TaxID=33882 RepID=UPI00214C3414|nr:MULTISPECIES: glycosyltransferase family 2 protein [unclassified Microbacterium]MCR2814210.1 glycosyltransferase family 2 protein [Microbacterium sp. zg.Y1084]MCR2820018.1 glycosyltransferase family 2 protein [Microbacterium sp. zg.Y1090]MDL5488218.1 glycosyltransferase family 2 protein [Microbacterium sp. zg-Y1211]WIM27967.1 glycosyltransferase family 2 protein [Microbacterium sp. zg-Y1090]
MPDESGLGGVSLRVVMPVHNAAAFFAEALRSVLADLPDDGEVVVVDDGSTDGSERLVQQAAERDTRITVLRHDEPQGVSRALNAGITHPGCPEYIAVAEHDDLVLPGRFAAQVHELREDAALGAVSSEGRYLGMSGRIAGRVSAGPKNREEFARMRAAGREILVPHPAITYRRDAVVAAGLYDPTFDYAQDLEIINRLVYDAGWEVRTITEPHVLYRIHNSSSSFAHISEQRMMTRYIVYRNRQQLARADVDDFATWSENNAPDRRTRWRWYRKDRGALHYRLAGLAWLDRRLASFVVNITAATALHPRWVLMKIRVATGR